MKQLKKLYAELLKAIRESNKIDYDTVKFCFQHGKFYPKETANAGILFVGRACNGWDAYSDDVNILFGKGQGAISKQDSIRYLVSTANPNYNANLSAFWRVIGNLSSLYYGKQWMDYIAWTNLYKIAPEGGNPDRILGGLQYNHCVRILECEIELLSPKVIVFFTGDESKDWITDDFTNVACGRFLPSYKKISWDKYSLMYAEVNGRIVIVTEHPQGKKEDPHVEALYGCIDRAMNYGS